MPAPNSSAVSAALNIRLLPFIQAIWMGGVATLVAQENASSPGTKYPYMTHLGNCDVATGAASAPKVKSIEFLNAMGTGVPYVEGEPITQLDMIEKIKVNAPTMFAMALARFAASAGSWSQSIVNSDQIVSISSVVLDQWYWIGAQAISQFVAYLTASPFTTYTAGTDYLLDTELGAVMFLSTGTIASATAISYAYQAAAISTSPQILPRSSTRFIRGGVYIYHVFAANEGKVNPDVWLRYIPFARIKPVSGPDFSGDKLSVIEFDIMPMNSNEISGQPQGYFKQIAGTARNLVR